MSIDEKFMRRCLQLAERAAGETYPNPLVGCVITDEQGKILGEGFHTRSGKPHAEIEAINDMLSRYQGNSLSHYHTLYVNLEPCSHHGKTPPCADRILEMGFTRVVIGSVDPHEVVAGRGIARLKDAGIEVTSAVLQEECVSLNKRFMTFHSKQRPYITLKWAQTADGFIAGSDGAPIAISCPHARQWMHRLRSMEHGILIGGATLRNDNPQLTSRLFGNRNPIPIIWSSRIIEPFLHLAKNTQTIQISDAINVQDLVNRLYRLGIQSVLVEGGEQVLRQFIDAELYDEAFIQKNPGLEIGTGIAAPKINRSANQEFTVGTTRIAKYLAS